MVHLVRMTPILRPFQVPARPPEANDVESRVVGDPETPEPASQALPRMLRPVLDPAVPSVDPTERRKARLLAAFLLILILVFGAVDVTGLLLVPGYAPPWIGYAFLATALLLNRFGRYTAAAAVTLTMFPAVILVMVATGGTLRDVAGLVYLVPGVLLASILHSARGTALFSGASVVTILMAPLLVPAASLRSVTTPLALVLITAGLAVVSILHRDRLEQDRQAELRDSEERLRLALEAAHMATWEWDVRSGLVRWSEGAEEVFGVPEGAAPATTDAYLARVHEEDREAARQAVESALESGSRRYTVQHRVIDHEGVVRWLEAYGRVIRDGRGRAVRTRGAILDVTDRQRIEGQREELIRELEAKNDELERFTYTVSHDLKSPIITIKGFLGLISKDLADGQTERLREDVARMSSAADGMQRLLHELLRLSRIGRVVSPSERVPFGDVAREAAAIVRARLEERGVRLEIDDDLPVVHGDRVRLVEVVQNLLENAAKFLGDPPSPVVRVGARPGEHGAPPVLFVQDHGIGIDPRFHEKVFGLFEKLDPRAEGSGVGLALVRRIVEVHGGRVWIESGGRGQGTTVCFTLPHSPPG
jgi:PAS domain S-box-containing protein